MSIKSRMKPAELLKPIAEQTELETKKSFKSCGVIMVSFSLATGTTTNTNNTIYQSATHTALTESRAVAAGDRLSCEGSNYNVNYVNNDSARYSVLFLSLVE